MPDEPLTVSLRAAHAGDRVAAERAYAALYPELLKIARARLRGNQPNTLLDTEALVHESFMRFVAADALDVADRRHFFTYAAKVMRNIVIDFARAKQAKRRGGDLAEVTLATGIAGVANDVGSVLDVERTLLALERLDPVGAEVVEMRYFGGYSEQEIATALGIADRTVRRHWERARLFMLAQMAP